MGDLDHERTLRLARADDIQAFDALMKASVRDIFPAFYDERQTVSAVTHVAVPDEMLIEDGTYFVIEERGAGLVACGGWSRRDKLYAGSHAGRHDARLLDPQTEPARVRAMFVRSDHARRGLGTRILEACEAAARVEGFTTLALMATLPGVQLYQRFRVPSDGRVPRPASAGWRAPERPSHGEAGRLRVVTSGATVGPVFGIGALVACRSCRRCRPHSAVAVVWPPFGRAGLWATLRRQSCTSEFIRRLAAGSPCV